MQKQSQLAVRRFLERARRQLRSQDELAELVSRLGYPLKRSAIGHWLTGRVERVPAWVVFALADELRLPLTEYSGSQSWDERLATLEDLVFNLTNWKQAIEQQLTSLRQPNRTPNEHD